MRFLGKYRVIWLELFDFLFLLVKEVGPLSLLLLLNLHSKLPIALLNLLADLVYAGMERAFFGLFAQELSLLRRWKLN